MPAIKSNDVQIAYEEYGDGPPLILLMGLSANGAAWELHVEEYKKKFRCIVVDNRGAGQSDKPSGPYTTRQMADDVAALARSLKIDRVHIAGISMGGAIAQEFALRYPERVSSLLLISTWAKFRPYEKACFEHLKDMRKHASPSEFMKLLQLWIFASGYYDKPENLEALQQGRDTADEAYMKLHAFCAQADACITHDTLDRIDEIKAPTMITVGDCDIFTPLYYSQQLNSKIQGSEMVTFGGCGHAHHWEDLQRFNRLSVEFMSKY